jgi:hypothetical protein
MPGYDARILQGVCIAYPIRIRLGYVSMKYPKTAQIRVSDTSGPNWIWPLRGKRAFKAELITALPTRRTHRLPYSAEMVTGEWRPTSGGRVASAEQPTATTPSANAPTPHPLSRPYTASLGGGGSPAPIRIDRRRPSQISSPSCPWPLLSSPSIPNLLISVSAVGSSCG